MCSPVSGIITLGLLLVPCSVPFVPLQIARDGPLTGDIVASGSALKLYSVIYSWAGSLYALTSKATVIAT